MTPAQCRSYLRDLERFGIKLGLDNIRTLLASFGDPQTAFPAVHVAGTNGKGSVCAMLAEVLRRHGLRVGLYTSPHLVRLEERIRVDGRMIPARELRRLLGLLRDRTEALLRAGTLEAPPTFFEVLTALAFLHFRERRVDVAVLEVGMGGRFDATNVVTPLVSVITTIARDHMEHLGTTLAAIAFEKAGIIKPGVPAVSGVACGPARSVIRRRAAEEGSALIEAFGRGTSLEARRTGERLAFTYRLEGETFRFSPGLAGAHQGRNAAVAAAVARVLGRTWRPLEKSLIEDGIEGTSWEGRLEQVGRRPRVILDGAHNEAGAIALGEYLRGLPGRPPVLVFAMMRDKTIGRVARALFPAARAVVLTSMPYKRAAAPEDVRRRAGSFTGRLFIESDPGRAVALARRTAGPKGTVVVTGSLYLVGEVKKRIARRRAF